MRYSVTPTSEPEHAGPFVIQSAARIRPSTDWRVVSRMLWALVLVSLAGPTFALPITSATGSYLSFRDCSSALPCDSGIPTQRGEDFTVAGGSAASASNSALGIGSASADFGAAIGAPVLRAEASTTSIGRVGATSIAVQRYQNTGATSTTAFFGGDLSFNLSGVSPSASVFTGIEVQLALFTTPTGTVDVADSLDRFAIFDLFSWQDLPGVVSIYDSGIVPYTTSTLPGSPIALTTPGITVAPGESFFVVARLLAIGAEGSTADASSTLLTGLYDSDSLEDRRLLTVEDGISAVQQVPLPSTLLLMILGLSTLLASRVFHR